MTTELSDEAVLIAVVEQMRVELRLVIARYAAMPRCAFHALVEECGAFGRDLVTAQPELEVVVVTKCNQAGLYAASGRGGRAH